MKTKMKSFTILVYLVICIIRTTYARHLNIDSDEIIDGKKNGKILTEVEINTILGYKGQEEILSESNEKRSALVENAWPRVSGKLFIPYVISNDFTSTQRTNIANAITKMNAHLSPCNTPTENVWKPRTTETNYVLFQTGNGCSSFVGKVSIIPQPITLAGGCISTTGGIILHEMLHAMGFFHQQSRADRDQYVEILTANILAGRENNFDLQAGSDSLCTTYDYESVMHYGRKVFSKNGDDTIRTIDPSKQDVIGQRTGLSAGDILRVLRLYSCGEITPVPCDLVTTTTATPTTTATAAPMTTATTASPPATTKTVAPTTTTTSPETTFRRRNKGRRRGNRRGRKRNRHARKRNRGGRRKNRRGRGKKP